jgi:uncharacterized protein YutE (UPF0331/DUF86 family)
MVDSERLARYIRELETYVKQVQELQKIRKKEFLSDWRIYDLVDRKLHLVLETFLSIGEIIISEFKLRKPDSYADIPKILAGNEVIPDDLGDKLIDLAKFRNVLVHEYLYLDHERVYEHLQNDMATIQEFLNHVKEFIKDKI